MKEIVIQADALSLEVQKGQRLAEAKNAAKRHAERQAAYDAWKDPEEMAKRKAASDEAAAASLAYLNSMLEPEEEIPIPDPLPPEMVGQSPSTIKKMLKHRKYRDAYSPVRKIEVTADALELAKASEEAAAKAIATSAKPVEKAISRAEASAFNPEAAPLKVFDETVTMKPVQKVTPERLTVALRFWRWLTE